MAQNNQEFQQLKQKYAPALTRMQLLQVQVQNLQLSIRGAAAAKDWNRIWEQVKMIDATLSDLVRDISAPTQHRQRSRCPPPLTAGASVSDEANTAMSYRQSVHENIQRQSQHPGDHPNAISPGHEI